MDRRRLIVLVVIAAAIALFFVADLGQYLSFDYLESQRDELRQFVADRPLLAGGTFFLIYVVVTGLSLPGAAVMTLAGGAIFGLLWGTVLASFASTIGATIAMLVARLLLRDAVQRRFASQLGPINRGIERDGAFYLFSLRLVPLFPFFMINLVMGLMPIRALTFFVASQIGMLPGTVVFVFAGTRLAEVSGPGDVLSPDLILAFVLLAAFPWIARAFTNAIARRRVLAAYRKPKRFDDNLIVIGAGSAGLISALIAATVKAKVTLIERNRMGGDCLNTGCVPSKALISAARAAHTVATADRFGLRDAQARVDFPAVMERVQDAIRTIEPNDSVERYEGLGVRCVQGSARLIDPWTVEVNGERRTARRIVIATGSEPLLPPIPGLDEVDPLTSDNVWDLRDLPQRLLVMGGGPIGCELAQSFARLGAAVTLVDMAPRLLPREDADVAGLIAIALDEEGIDVRAGHRAVRFRKADQGGVLVAETAEGEVELAFDRVLVAVGRRPVTEGLGLEELGVRRTPAGTLEVDEALMTTVPTIYACGDVVGPYQFTHMASHQAWYASVNALFGPFRRYKVNYRVVPWTTYTDPEVARVGLNEDDARQQGVAVEVTRFEFAHNDRAIAERSRVGFIKVLTPPGRDRILGVTIAGPHAGELLAEYVLAMTHGIGLKQIMGTIHVYPTFAEINKSAASAWRKANAPTRVLDWVGRFHDLRR
ncbi:MAG: FAD-dependent oxidoreductase [Gammaproteobacteria bacterium]|nr:FAD-dependent oxidoreductase [Gammaproteobacteria bacterium]